MTSRDTIFGAGRFKDAQTIATCFWTVESDMPVSSLRAAGVWSQKASGVMTPALIYFFRLTAGIPISFKTWLLYTTFADERICSASCSPMPAFFRDATSALARSASSRMPDSLSASWIFA